MAGPRRRRRPPVEDTAVAAYLLNPARTNYKLEEVCAELLGEGPGLARAGHAGAVDLGALGDGSRARSQEVGLHALYEDIERPLVPRARRAWSATASAWTRRASASSPRELERAPRAD